MFRVKLIGDKVYGIGRLEFVKWDNVVIKAVDVILKIVARC